MSWGTVPNKIVTTFAATAGGAVARTEPVYPFPNIAVYTGQGDPNNQANWRESPPQHNYPRHYDWLGNFHYTPA
jgi:feruloyl esterase